MKIVLVTVAIKKVGEIDTWLSSTRKKEIGLEFSGSSTSRRLYVALVKAVAGIERAQATTKT